MKFISIKFDASIKVFLGFSCIFFSGCATVGNEGVYNQYKEPSSQGGFVEALPKLSIDTLAKQSDLDTFKFGDTANITMYNIESLSGSYVVDREGIIDFPEVGQVFVEGLNTAELQRLLKNKYRDAGIRNPSVSVKIEPVVLGRIVVDGAVEAPGVFEVREVIKLSEAIALGGGTTLDADQKDIFLVRGVSGARVVKRINLKDIREKAEEDPEIYPNDLVFVQSSGLRLTYNEFLRTAPLISSILFAATRR